MINRRQLLASLAPPLVPGAARAQPASLESLKLLEPSARAEGRLKSVAMPDGWANWQATWARLKRRYGIEHVDEDMNSADELDRMEAEADGGASSIDIGDIGYEYAALARARMIARPHRPGTWDEIPAWARDEQGYWALAYTGTIAFAIDRRSLGGRALPRSWKSLFAGDCRIGIGRVGSASQGSASVLAAAIALGGGENRLQPALAAFARAQRQQRLHVANPRPDDMERGEADVFVMWDFNALAYRERLRRSADFEVVIPEDGSLTSGYTPIINRFAPHPNAALLAHEFIFSDAGQLHLAEGYARPIRIERLALPAALRQRMLPDSQYQSARLVQPALWAWEARRLPKTWRDDVMGGAGTRQ